MPSVRGPRGWPITFASTSTPASAFPSLRPSPSLTSSTRPSLIEAPASSESRSTRIRSPGETRYCLPPLTTTADGELSGLGTARDCTKRKHRLPARGPSPADDRRREGCQKRVVQRRRSRQSSRDRDLQPWAHDKKDRRIRQRRQGGIHREDKRSGAAGVAAAPQPRRV